MQPLMPPVQTPDNLFHDGNPLTGELGTIVDAEHLNNVQAAIRNIQYELIVLLSSAQMQPDSTVNNQLYTALGKIFLSRSNAFADIASDGQAAVTRALTNLSLERYEQTPDETHIRSPDMKSYVLVNNNGWGAWNTEKGVIPLALGNGGTGAKNASEARKNLNLQGFSSTDDQSAGAYNHMLSPNNNYSLVMANGGTWGAQDVTGKTIPLPVDRGGTGATKASDARTNLGMGKLSTLDTAPIANGGTGATTAADARTNLGLGNAATFTVGSGANQIPDMNSFTKGSGWQKLPSGKILQWFQVTTSISAAVQVNFPIPFPSGASMIVASPVDVNVPNWASAALYNASTCLVSAYDGSKVRVATTVYIFAIGE
ncbi:TPA: hypothetical protein ACNP9N_001870 [Enterobacter asburiae]